MHEKAVVPLKSLPFTNIEASRLERNHVHFSKSLSFFFFANNDQRISCFDSLNTLGFGKVFDVSINRISKIAISSN